MIYNNNNTPKLPEIDFAKATSKIRPFLHRYLTSVSHLIDGRSYQKISDTFTNNNKPKLITTYESLKKLVNTMTNQWILNTSKNITKITKKK